MLYHVRTNSSFYLCCDTWLIQSFSLSHSSPPLKVSCDHHSTPSMCSICKISKGFFFYTRGTHIENLAWFFHDCWGYELVSSCLYSKNITKSMALSLVHMRQPLAESGFPPLPWSWKWASPSQRKISALVTFLFFWYFFNCSQICHFPSKRGHNYAIPMHTL